MNTLTQQPKTQADWRKYIQSNLLDNDRWCLRGLEYVYSLQTRNERMTEKTYVNNCVGFTQFDAEILSSFARQYETRGRLTSKQMTILRRRILKYWRQIMTAIKEKESE